MAYIWHVQQPEEMEGRGKVTLKNEASRNTAPGRHLGQVRNQSKCVVVVALEGDGGVKALINHFFLNTPRLSNRNHTFYFSEKCIVPEEREKEREIF